MATLDTLRCTCSERFPGLKIHSHSTECLQCSRDAHTPKLYSSTRLAHVLHSRSIYSGLWLLLHVDHSIGGCELTHQCCVYDPTYMFNISIAGFNTGGGNVNFKGFANHVYRLPHGQYGYCGHVTNLLQDIASFTHSSFTFTILAKARPTMPCICLVLVSCPDHARLRRTGGGRLGTRLV